MMRSNHKHQFAVGICLAVFLLPLVAQARWISVDPLAAKYPSVSPYVYTLNNPLKYIDPDGEKVEYAAGNATKASILAGTYNPRANNSKLDKNFKSTMDKSVKEIISTSAGNKLLGGLENAKDASGNDVMTFIVENNAGETFHATIDATTHIVSIDPSVHHNVLLKDLSTGKTQTEPASTTRILSHELGHATGTKDDGPGKMNNVKKHENPIMIPLEHKKREKY